MRENGIFFGVDYYPEHWPRERWEIDAKLMKAAGFDAVRLAEFAWVKMENASGQFDFLWLDEAIALFARYGIKTILGTPTAAPPAWLIEKNPDMLPVNKSGCVLGFGGRHHVCHSNAAYREHAGQIVGAMAEHYCKNQDVIGWQIDNELGNSHEELCMCDNCRSGFQKWLEKKYLSIENLNESWGTAFWSQTYSGFNEIPAPRITPNSHSPSLLLDWKRFCSDLIIEFSQLQVEIIREKCPEQFITSNLMGFFDKVDYFKLAGKYDFASHDQYPGGFWLKDKTETPPSALAANLDLIRGIKDKPFWIMEQQAGPTGWEIMGKTPRPGQLRLWTAQSVARGADAVVYFRWRTCIYGTEQYWHGILPHNGIPGRRYDEIKNTISELRPVMEKIKGNVCRPDAALLFSYEQNWALNIQRHHPELDYREQIMKYHGYFYRNNIAVDFIFNESDFSKYRLIVAPLQFLTTKRLIEKISNYVSEGGYLVLTMRTGVKNENNVCIDDTPLPCEFGNLLGIEIPDYDCLRGGGVPVVMGAATIGIAQKWCDIIDLKGAEALAHYGGEYYRDAPAFTVNKFGKGRVYYIGFEPDEDSMGRVMGIISGELQIRSMAGDEENIEVSCRPSANGNYFFALNHSGDKKKITAKPGWKAVLGTETLPPYGVTIFLKDAAAKGI